MADDVCREPGHQQSWYQPGSVEYVTTLEQEGLHHEFDPFGQ